MITEKLYDLDSYVTEFKCKVIDLYETGEKLHVVLDRTAFFPEGGGQTSDRGYLDDVYVEDVQDKCGKIVHIVENSKENSEKLLPGTVLKGKIDFKKRFSDMQQHSGEHIFSGIVHSLYGYDNVGFHLGSETVILDFNGTLNKDDVCKVEKLVNEAVWDNKEIHVFFPTDEEKKEINYRSKKEVDGPLRLVEIPGVDICACCAPHVRRTGEIGIIEVVKFEKYKGGTRLNILCGERALIDIRTKLDQNHEVAKLLSAKETETAKMAEKLKSDNAELSYKLGGAKLEKLKMLAESREESERSIVFCDLTEGDLIREYANLLSEKSRDFSAVFGGENGEYKFVIISKSGFDLDTLCKKMREAFGARGGGRNGIVQGSVSAGEADIRTLLER
ncbi:MAG: alanyl-tRNA editing protein [Acutalibacteraceae bacterium]